PSSARFKARSRCASRRLNRVRGPLKPFSTSRSGALLSSPYAPSASRKSSTESRPKKTVSLPSHRSIRTQITVVEIVRRTGNLPKEEELSLAKRIRVLSHVGAKARARNRIHVLHGIDAETVHVGLAYPVTVRLDQGVDHRGASIIVVVGVVLEARDVAV